ncbi:RNA-binding protein Ro60-like [Saccostrea cucullata]|uniref:RNA-binding protein Ro60-like n=1 Tax=Saccostrea cuccullata TaxID=36930 RepID=UPI002ED572BF
MAALSVEKNIWKFLVFGVNGRINRPPLEIIRNEVDGKIDSFIRSGSGMIVIKLLKKISGKHFKFYPVAYALAKCARCGDRQVSKEAYLLIPKVCKTPSQLFLFHYYCKAANLRGDWPRSHRRAIAAWYTENKENREDVVQFARHVTKYKCRYGISQRRVIKSCHPKPPNEKFGFIFRYITKGLKKANEKYPPQNSAGKKVMSDRGEDFLRDYEAIKSGRVPLSQVTDAIKKWRLTWEHIPPKFFEMKKDEENKKRCKEIWRTLLLQSQMPMTAIVRNLVKMTRLGLLVPNSKEENTVCQKLNDPMILEQSNIHPYHVLTALAAYRRGQRRRNGEDIKWAVSEQVVQALFQSFLHTQALPFTDKRLLLAIDSTIEMNNRVGSSCLPMKEAAAALALAIHQNSKCSETVTFGNVTSKFEFQPHDQSVFDIENALERIHQRTENFQRSDFNAPFRFAKQNIETYDGIVLLTSLVDTEEAATIRRCFQEYKEQRNGSVKAVVITHSHSNHVGTEEDDDILDVEGADGCAAKQIIEFISDDKEGLEEVDFVEMRD